MGIKENRSSFACPIYLNLMTEGSEGQRDVEKKKINLSSNARATRDDEGRKTNGDELEKSGIC